MNKAPWIQAAIDVEDIDLAKKIAFMALDAGAEWLEVGTPLLYQYGHSAIGMLRKAVGKRAVLVADYKTPFARLCAAQAARESADFVLLSAGYGDLFLQDNINFSRKYGVEPIFHLSVRSDDFNEQASKLYSMGAEYVFSHRYSEMTNTDGIKERTDNLENIKGLGCKVGITSDNLEEALDTVNKGADWITFGWVLRSADANVCKQWIDAIHSAR